MKLKRLIGILLDTIYRDNIYLINPIINWTLINGVNRHFRDNYNKVLPTLLKWQEKEYISLVNDDDIIFIFHPEKLPLKEDLRSESVLVKKEEIIEENGKLRIKVEGKEDILADKALLSIGRVPDLEGIGEVEFELDRGRIKVNEYMETSVPGIYAPGDINGTKMLAHAAFRMGEVAAENALKGNHHVAKLNLTPAAIYTLPEVAAVGLTEEQAREKYDVAIGKFNFAANGRAIASDAAQGFVKVIADKKYGEVLGVHIIGPAAAELINEASTIIEMEITVEEMLKTIHGHPTFSEVMYEAFADVLGLAVHSPKKK